MLWAAIVSYFSLSSRIAAIYAMITLIILKDNHLKIIYAR